MEESGADRSAGSWQLAGKEKEGEHGTKKKLRWAPLALIAFFGYLAYLYQISRVRRGKTGDEYVASDFQVECFRRLPWNALSRLWGRLHNAELPSGIKTLILKFYVSFYRCNMDEAEVEELQYYKNLAALFKRSLKPGARPIDTAECLVAPSDGRVLSFGQVDGEKVQQVKHITYSLRRFLGENAQEVIACDSRKPGETTSCYSKACLADPINNVLYQCVIYLAPGDYHRFHSPVSWDVYARRHFPGDLLSVNPRLAALIPELFTLNERVVYFGKWKHGFFSMAAIGATNVGSIRCNFDADLMTNVKRYVPNSVHELHFPEPVHFEKGDDFGEFNFGSTIVLIFEAPKGLKFAIQQEQRVFMGQALSECLQDS
ncbi:unnamed protein product [Darwinula stevensoni]|uniref:Phosphatidylserine decarboxylase proenzyme, mitochondrial n=1 Tax=Darwinula stevensoni TaxID=69355 RepID=A0A7R9FP49_9CRUS|nr:unnamed protein product [Darwinula stevensoni]CAG0897575.1 unnamed protein product [Darwinula stevensoni]